MRLKHLIIALVAALALAACGKKSDSDGSSSESEDKPKDVLEAYNNIQQQATKLHLTDSDAAGLAAEEWEEDDWGTTARFNCFGECDGSITAKKYLDDALNEETSGPLGTAMDSISTLCMVGALFTGDLIDSDGLPVVGDHDLEFNDDVKEKLIDECDFEEDEMDSVADQEATAEVAEVSGDDYDRKITFTIESDEGTEEFSFYYKNSDDVVRLGTFTKEGDADDGEVQHSMFSIDLENKIFRMEYFNRTWPIDADDVAGAGSYSFYRGYYEEETGEVRFFSNMGSSDYVLNNTFLAISGREDEDQAGAYFARTGENTDLEGAYVCFDVNTMEMVNNTGCDENEDDDRIISWGPEETLWKKVNAKDISDWGDDPVTVPNFNAETIFTVEPNYK